MASKYQKLALQLSKTSAPIFNVGYSGGSVSYSGGGETSVASSPIMNSTQRAEFWRQVQIRRDQSIYNGVPEAQAIRSAMEELSPYIESDSILQNNFITLRDNLKKAEFKEQIVKDEVISSLSDLDKDLIAVNTGLYNDPMNYLLQKANAYNSAEKAIKEKITQYQTEGYSTSELQKGLDNLTIRREKEFDPIVQNFLAPGVNGDLSKIQGYAWYMDSNPIDGSLQNMTLKKIDGNKDYGLIEGAQNGGLPVYISKFQNADGTTFSKLQGNNIVYNDSDQFTLQQSEPFSLNNTKHMAYPDYPEGTIAQDGDKNLYLKQKDGWYKTDGGDTLQEYLRNVPTFGTGKPNITNNIVNPVILSEDQKIAMGDFINDDGVSQRIINKDVVAGMVAPGKFQPSFLKQQFTPSSLKKSLNSFTKENQSMFSANKLERSIGAPYAQPSGNAMVKPEQQAQAQTLERSMAKPTLAKAEPRKTPAIQQSTQNSSIFNRAKGIFSGIFGG